MNQEHFILTIFPYLISVPKPMIYSDTVRLREIDKFVSHLIWRSVLTITKGLKALRLQAEIQQNNDWNVMASELP